MNNFITFAIFLLPLINIALVSSLSSSSSSGKIIQWINLTNDELPLRNLEPAGFEHGRNLYVARLRLNWNWLPGKLQITENEIQVITLEDGEIRNSSSSNNHYQILNAPPGTLSWVPHPSTNLIPENAVGGGQTKDPHIIIDVFVCRVKHDEKTVIPGYMTWGTCYYVYDGQWAFDKENVELLVINSVGKAKGVKFADKLTSE